MESLKIHQPGILQDENDDLIKYKFDQSNCRVTAYDHSRYGNPRNLIDPTEDPRNKYILEYFITQNCRTYIDFDFKRPILINAIGFKSAGCCPSMDPRNIKIFHKVPEA